MATDTASDGLAGHARPIVHTDPSRHARVVYALARGIGKQFYRAWPLGDKGIRTLSMLDQTIARLPRLLDVEHAQFELGSVPAVVYRPETPADDRLAGASVLYLHGGGFTFCGTGTHQRVASRMAQALAVPVYSLLYRQLPDAGVGTAVHDAVAAYRQLLDIAPDPRKIIVAGDSSGAFLAAKLCELAAEDGFVPPAAYVGYSPHVDLDVDLRDHELIRYDALMPVSAYRRVKQKWARGPVDPRGERSILRVDPAVFPPTFLTAASREMFEPDIIEFAELLGRSGRTVEAHVWHGQVHAFPVLDTLLPESRETMRLTAEFLRGALSPRADEVVHAPTPA